MSDRFDIVVVGSGIAALSCALAARDARVCVVTPGTLGADGASALAQGGIAAALDASDSVESHVGDTLAAGARHNVEAAVRAICAGAPDAIAWLDAHGVAFDRARDGRYALGREAAHSAHRIVHADGDSTGAAVMRALAAAARASASIVVREKWSAFAAVGSARRVRGVWSVDEHGAVHAILARHVVLATGGIGGLYRYSTNPRTACGDGLALARSVGARLRDLEFVQFHPTALASAAGGDGPLPLVTEALRGAGATLVDADGRRFMRAAHRDAELAPRDVVARAVFDHLAHGPVFLDARASVGAAFPARFPGVFALLAARGIDPRVSPIPVTPAQHYHMGGVAVDELGATSVPGLFAVGECAATGVHGANRLASNSLLEGVVFGRALGATLARHRIGLPWAEPGGAPPAPAPDDAAADATLRETMWSQVGLVRDARGLSEAIETLDALGTPRAALGADIARAALARRESLGAHFRTDAPSASPDVASPRLAAARS